MVTLPVVGGNYPLKPVAQQEKVLHNGCACSFNSLLCQFLFTSDPKVQEVGKEGTESLHSAFRTPQVSAQFLHTRFSIQFPPTLRPLPHPIPTSGPCPIPFRPQAPAPSHSITSGDTLTAKSCSSLLIHYGSRAPLVARSPSALPSDSSPGQSQDLLGWERWESADCVCPTPPAPSQLQSSSSCCGGVLIHQFISTPPLSCPSASACSEPRLLELSLLTQSSLCALPRSRISPLHAGHSISYLRAVSPFLCHSPK